MAVVRLQSAWRSFLYPPSFFSQHLPLNLPRPLLRTCNLLRGLFSILLRSSLNTFLLTFPDLFFALATSVRIFCPLHRISISRCCRRKSANRVASVRRFSSMPLQRAIAPLEVVLVSYGTSIITALY